MIFTDFHEVCSDFLGFSRKTLQLLKISRFQFDFSMIKPDIYLIFDVLLDLILLKCIFDFHIGTTPGEAGWSPPRRAPQPAAQDFFLQF